MLRINRDFSLDDLEQALETVAHGEHVLQLPHSLKANAAGLETALIQLIVTWARKAGQRSVLRLYSGAGDEAGQRAFAETVFGLTALNLAHTVQSRSGEELERFSLLALAREYVIAMAERPVGALREFDKASIPFVCIDNARNYRRPARLYKRGTDRVRDRSDFSSLVSSCARQLPISRRQGLNAILEPAASLLFEAFHNTHDHAQTDYRGDVLRRSVRGFSVSFRYVRLDVLPGMGGANTALAEYFEDWRPSTAGAKHAQFLELGIFDSGPGLARRWLSHHQELARCLPNGDDLAVEYRAILDCFEKGATTKASGTSGNGLFRIMQVVKRTGGFMRLRSGSLSLLKSFGDSGTALLPEDLLLVDLATGTVQLQRKPWAEGTTISVLLPMNRAMVS